MRSKFDKYMKDTVKFSVLLILYYLFLYGMARVMLSIITSSYQLSIGYDIGCHVFAFLFLIISFTSYESNDNNDNNINAV